jgi:hypothetical protein
MNYFKKIRLKWKLAGLESKEAVIFDLIRDKEYRKKDRTISIEYKRIRREIASLKSILERNGVQIQALTIEQVEYVGLKGASERMRERFHRHQDEGKIPNCIPAQDSFNDCTTVNETRMYLLIEMMEGKHNEFLQQIIDRSKDK